jgi:hypothetical protein
MAPSASDRSSSGTEQLGVDLELGADAGAARARAVGRVERERPRLDLVDGDRVVVGAGHPLREPALPDGVRVVRVHVDELDEQHAAREVERGLDRVGQASLGAGVAALGHQPVDDDLDGVLELLLQLRRLGQRDDLAVDAGPRETLGLELGEQVDVLALAALDDRREHLEPGAVGQLQQPVDDLLWALPGDRLTADRAVRAAGPREEQAEVVVDLGDRADGRPRVAVGRLLVDRDGRRQPLDEVDVGLVHLPEELARIRAERLDVAALALREDRVEGERGLAAAGEPGEADQRVARQLDGDVLEVVLPGAAHDEVVVPQRAERRVLRRGSER